MRAYTQPLLVDGLGGADQACQALETLPLRAGTTGVHYDERWLQTLIQDHPALLPVADIEPGLVPLIPICMELPVPSGFVDNLMLTAEGGIIVVETKLWRNPEARREVVGQVLDYAKDLSGFTYEHLQRAVGSALKRPGVKLFDLVSAEAPGADERRFIDAVSRNLSLGRFLLIIAGDGIQEGADQLASFLQRHVGLHFTLSLVEMSMWRSPSDGRVLVQPRILAKTVQIERAVVRVEAGVTVAPVNIEPAKASTTKATTVSEDQFYEALGAVASDLPARLKAFLAETADLGVYADIKRNLSLKWRGPNGQDYNLGSVGLNGTVGTDYCNWNADAIGRIDLSHAYLADVAALVPGSTIRQTPKPTGWRVVTDKGDPPLSQLLTQHQGWAAAIERYTSALREALQVQA